MICVWLAFTVKKLANTRTISLLIALEEPQTFAALVSKRGWQTFLADPANQGEGNRAIPPPWITSDLYKLIKTKNKLYRALVRCKFDDKQEYKRYKKMRNKVNHQLEISKRKYYQSQFLEYINDSAKMWKLINTLSNSQVKTHSFQTNYLTQ